MPPEPADLFLSAERAAALESWRSPDADVVTLHLDVDAAGAFASTLPKLAREAAADPKMGAVRADIERLAAFALERFPPAGRRGLCAASCLRRGLFEAFALPERVNSSLTLGDRPDVRVLGSLRERYRRFLLLQADSRRARFVEIHLGEGVELESGSFDAPRPADLAERAADWIERRRAELLILGASGALAADLARALPPPMQDAVICEPLLTPDRPLAAVLERVRYNEREALKLRDQVLVRRFLDELREGGAVSGLEAVATALQQGCVKRVLVCADWAKMGRRCPGCGRLSLNHSACPWCFRRTEHVLDVVAELVGRAVEEGVEVDRISGCSDFEAIGRIGAQLAVPDASRRRGAAPRSLRSVFSLKTGRASPLRPRP